MSFTADLFLKPDPLGPVFCLLLSWGGSSALPFPLLSFVGFVVVFAGFFATFLGDMLNVNEMGSELLAGVGY